MFSYSVLLLQRLLHGSTEGTIQENQLHLQFSLKPWRSVRQLHHQEHIGERQKRVDGAHRRAGQRKSRNDSGASHHQPGKGGIYRIQQTVQVPRDNDLGEETFEVVDTRIVFTTLQQHALDPGDGFSARCRPCALPFGQVFALRSFQAC